MSKKTAPRRTQADRTRIRKEQVIHEATLHFAQFGYRGAKLADIARAAGVSGPGLLHHFPSKEHLLMDVLSERDRTDQQRFQPTAPGEEDKILPALQALVDHNQTLPGLVQLFTVLVAESLDPDHPSHDFFKQRYHKIRSELTPPLQRAQALGIIRSDIPAENLAAMIFALMDGLQLQWLMDPEALQMAPIFQTFLQLLSPANPVPRAE